MAIFNSVNKYSSKASNLEHNQTNIIKIVLLENDEELELKCEKLAEELAEKVSTIDLKQPRKRKRTEKGRDWDETVEKELAPSKQIIVDEQSVAQPSPNQIANEETPSPKGIIADKPRKTARKQKIVDEASTKKKTASKGENRR